jgi:hypothetical protein
MSIIHVRETNGGIRTLEMLPERVRKLNGSLKVCGKSAKGKMVVYWMSRDQRVQVGCLNVLCMYACMYYYLNVLCMYACMYYYLNVLCMYACMYYIKVCMCVCVYPCT